MQAEQPTTQADFQVGDAVYCLVGQTTVLAIGVVAPRSPIDAATLDGYDSSAFWRKAEAVAAATAVNADALDGIDSTAFLRRQVAGATERVWWVKASGTAVGGQFSVNHPLGRAPSLVVALATVYGNAIVQKAEAVGTTSITLYVTGGTAVDAWVLVIG